jgi:hypothetical protein
MEYIYSCNPILYFANKVLVYGGSDMFLASYWHALHPEKYIKLLLAVVLIYRYIYIYKCLSIWYQNVIKLCKLLPDLCYQ